MNKSMRKGFTFEYFCKKVCPVLLKMHEMYNHELSQKDIGRRIITIVPGFGSKASGKILTIIEINGNTIVAETETKRCYFAFFDTAYLSFVFLDYYESTQAARKEIKAEINRII